MKTHLTTPILIPALALLLLAGSLGDNSVTDVHIAVPPVPQQ